MNPKGMKIKNQTFKHILNQLKRIQMRMDTVTQIAKFVNLSITSLGESHEHFDTIKETSEPIYSQSEDQS